MLRFLVVLLGCILLPLSTHAYSIGKTNGTSGQVLRWHTSNIGYYIYTSGSADVLDGSDLAAVQNGFQQWSSIGCSSLNVSYMGTTNNKYNMASGADTNGKNEVGWAEGSEWKYGAYVLGLTQTSFSPESGEISEADIAFNGYQNKWSTNGKSGTTDILNVASHEEGHFVGAQHVLGGYSSSNPPTMAPKADPYLKSQTLEADDKLLACYLY
ncbi:MAG TPA: hypothetical protein EYN66_01495, partial [Myxococcales bacterium]|nr:hypothetical protein [Myxococcales bacterium]